MPRVLVNQGIKTLSEFRANAAACIRQVQTTKRPLVITTRGKGAAVLLDVDEYESLIEKSEALQDLHAAERQVEEVKGCGNEGARRQALGTRRSEGTPA
ncbi:MAG: type II toxin-antitoxin system Phd/YefM family antitoxin [Thermodesulfovibrionales bacterium]